MGIFIYVKNMRTTARETLFKIIFSSQFNDDVNGELKHGLFKADELSKDDVDYCERVLTILSAHKQEFVALIDKHSSAFPEKRIFPADRAILFIALCEILYMEDIPDKVALNEAANIASKYSSERSASYITGILSAVSGEKDV